MALRRSVNNAILSDDGTWVWNGTSWKPTTPTPGPKPGLIDTARAAKTCTPGDLMAARTWLKLIDEHGTVDAVHHHLGETEAQGRKQLVKHYPDHDAYTADIEHMNNKGWRIANQTQSGERTSLGRTAAGVVIGGALTGGMGAAVGGMIGGSAKKASTITIVWERD